jgi:subtilisin family serine protease
MYLGKGLPREVTARSFRDDGNLEARDSQHGILCAEVVHALAPEAEILLANWEPERPASFLEAARWAKERGARVLSCSVIMPSWSDGEGGGAFHEGLTRIVGDGSRSGAVLCFASAGNTAQRHWHGKLRFNKDAYHQWRATDIDNPISPWSSERVSVELYGATSDGLEVMVLDSATGAVVARRRAQRPDASNAAAHECVVRFQPRPGGRYQLRVRCDKPVSSPVTFHVVVLGGDLAIHTAGASIACPADGPNVLAVGAVGDSNQRLDYSACGPNSRSPKPDFVMEVPFPSVVRQRPFDGTSAAAPQAAALAALFWARYPNSTANQIKQALKRSARDLGPPGHDWETGYGRLRLQPSPTR